MQERSQFSGSLTLKLISTGEPFCSHSSCVESKCQPLAFNPLVMNALIDAAVASSVQREASSAPGDGAIAMMRVSAGRGTVPPSTAEENFGSPGQGDGQPSADTGVAVAVGTTSVGSAVAVGGAALALVWEEQAAMLAIANTSHTIVAR
jgi:hypothetical protein